MTENSKINQFINEIHSFEWERTILDRNEINFENYEVLSDEVGNVQIILTNIFDDFIPYFSKDGKVNFLNPSTGMTLLPDKEVITFNSDSEEIEVPYSVLNVEIGYEKDFESKSIKLPFIYLNKLNILDIVFGEHVEIFNKQMNKLKKKYYHLKENDFAENRLLFEDKYKVNFISDDNFLQFLYQKFKLLRFNFSFSHFEKFNLVRIDGLILTWNKRDITKDISISVFHEYCQMIKSKFESELSMHSLPAPAEPKGFDLRLTEEQLIVLHKELIENKFLKIKTKLNHFINAFNGEVLKDNFKPLEWIEPTKGAIFIEVFTNKNPWTKLESIMVKANYSKLLSQSKGIENSTYKETYTLLSQIKNNL